MRAFRLSLILLSLTFIACQKENSEELENANRAYASTDVLVKIKPWYPIDSVFDFINGFNHTVEHIYSQKYSSALPTDSLQYVLDYLNAKSYTNDGNAWFVTGYVDAQSNAVTIFPRLFDMHIRSHQDDWLASMEILKLQEDQSSATAGCIIYFHVPAGAEKEWERKFESYDFVEWAELNYFSDIKPGG